MTEQEIKKIDEWIDSIITTQKTMPGVDGYILKQIADIIIERKKLEIQTSYLYVSRYSLRNALYYKCETAEDFENAGLFTGYTLKSAKNFLKRAGLDNRQRAEVYKKIGFFEDENKDLSDSEYSAFCEKVKTIIII